MFTFDVAGLDEVVRLFSEIAPRESANLMRTVMLDIAKEAAKDVRNMERIHYKTGNLNNQINAQRLRASTRNTPMAGVKMTKKLSVLSSPAPGVTRRRNKKRELQEKKGSAFYWKFLEYGTQHIHADNMLQTYQAQLNSRLPLMLRNAWAKKLEERLVRFNRRNATRR